MDDPQNEFIYQGKVAISQCDKDGIITFVNRKFVEISGYSKNELIGSKFDVLKHPDVPQSIYEKIYKTLHSHQTYNGVLKNLRKDAKYFWVDIEVMPILDGDSLSGFISVSKPSPRKNIQENEKLLKKEI